MIRRFNCSAGFINSPIVISTSANDSLLSPLPSPLLWVFPAVSSPLKPPPLYSPCRASNYVSDFPARLSTSPAANTAQPPSSTTLGRRRPALPEAEQTTRGSRFRDGCIHCRRWYPPAFLGGFFSSGFCVCCNPWCPVDWAMEIRA